MNKRNQTNPCMIPDDSNHIQTHIGSMDGIFTYIWLILRVNVGKHSSPIDPMGYGIERFFHFLELDLLRSTFLHHPAPSPTFIVWK